MFKANKKKTRSYTSRIRPYSPEIDKIFSGNMDFSQYDEPYDSGDSEVENTGFDPLMTLPPPPLPHSASFYKYKNLMSQDSPSKSPFKQINESVSMEAQAVFQHQESPYDVIDGHLNPFPALQSFNQSEFSRTIRVGHSGGTFQNESSRNGHFNTSDLMERPKPFGLVTHQLPISMDVYEQSMMTPRMGYQNAHQEIYAPFHSAPMSPQDVNGPFHLFGLMERPKPSGLVTPPPPVPKHCYEQSVMAPGMAYQNLQQENFSHFQVAHGFQQESSGSFHTFAFMERAKPSGLQTPPPPVPKHGCDSSMTNRRVEEKFSSFQMTPIPQQEENRFMVNSDLESVYFGAASPTRQNESGSSQIEKNRSISYFGNYEFY